MHSETLCWLLCFLKSSVRLLQISSFPPKNMVILLLNFFQGHILVKNNEIRSDYHIFPVIWRKFWMNRQTYNLINHPHCVLTHKTLIVLFVPQSSCSIEREPGRLTVELPSGLAFEKKWKTQFYCHLRETYRGNVLFTGTPQQALESL